MSQEFRLQHKTTTIWGIPINQTFRDIHTVK